MNDAAFQGEDEQTQRQVYRRSYDDCLSWERRTRLSLRLTDHAQALVPG